MTRLHRLLAASLLVSMFALPALGRERRTNFRGTLDGRLNARMTLVRDGDRVKGIYLYEAVGEPIRVEGTANGDDVRLVQYAEGGAKTGQFQGTWRGKTFAGTWSQPDDPKARPLDFTFDSGSLPDDGKTGTYTLFNGRNTETLLVLLLPGQRILFRLTAFSIPEGDDPSFANTGVASGSARIAGDAAVYEAEGCKITLRFATRSIRVSQAAPGPACGMGQSVDGSGTYRQTDNEVDLAAIAGL